MMCLMKIHILLKRGLTKIWVSLVQKRSKNSYENAVGELKVCKIGTSESSIQQYFSVYWLPPKWEVETPIYRKMGPRNP